MKNNLQNNKVAQKIKQHPTATKLTGGGFIGAIITVILNKLNGIIDTINFNEIVKWFSKLKALIGNHLFDITILAIVIGVVICRYKKLDNRRKLEHDILSNFPSMIKNDNNISGVDIDGKGSKMSVSIKRNNNGNAHEQNQKQDKDNLVHFPTSRNSEVEK